MYLKVIQYYTSIMSQIKKNSSLPPPDHSLPHFQVICSMSGFLEEVSGSYIKCTSWGLGEKVKGLRSATIID